MCLAGDGVDLIMETQTPKSKHIIAIPAFLYAMDQDYPAHRYDYQPDEGLFPVTKSYLHGEMTRGTKKSGIKRIRVNDLSYPNLFNIQTF
jgi:hypothetical protein